MDTTPLERRRKVTAPRRWIVAATTGLVALVAVAGFLTARDGDSDGDAGWLEVIARDWPF